jgi:large subunit ribosomal protein L13
LRTYSLKKDEIAKEWLVIDATDVPLGRLASRVASFLRGKHKATFTPHLDMGDNVIVINAKSVKLTGLKREKKIYLHYTGYVGGQRVTPLKTLMATCPERVVMMAVRGMLPKSRLGRRQLKHLRVYAAGEHPHAAQQPRTIELA